MVRKVFSTTATSIYDTTKSTSIYASSFGDEASRLHIALSLLMAVSDSGQSGHLWVRHGAVAPEREMIHMNQCLRFYVMFAHYNSSIHNSKRS